MSHDYNCDVTDCMETPSRVALNWAPALKVCENHGWLVEGWFGKYPGQEIIFAKLAKSVVE